MGNCNSCSTGCSDTAPNRTALVQIGGVYDYVVALAGNPNTGKSTVFNYLTGLHQHTGNWPGKTVARAEGFFTQADTRYKLIDLPGTYSLMTRSVDEEIARDFILFGRPDCTVVVCDATVLERSLHLVLQIMEITNRVVVCANLIDEANRKMIALEARALEAELGVPVVPTSARRGHGMDHLLQHIHEVATGAALPQPRRARLDDEIESAIGLLVPQLLQMIPNLPCPRWVAMRLLAGDERMEQALRSGELAEFSKDPAQELVLV
ncbi:MAG: GTPase Der [Phycisphaerae bacterium]|nr:GTPase Der [Phycisphaerae bacterium]